MVDVLRIRERQGDRLRDPCQERVTVYPDIKSEPSLILMTGRRSGAPGMTVTRPLIIYKDGTREYTDDMERIYSDFSLSHITDRKRR